jgi:polar amino acid transport system substrate-binding protein
MAFHRFVPVMAAWLLVCASRADAVETVVLTGHPNWPPFSSEDGERIVGIGAELAEIVFRDLGFQTQARPSGNWKRVQAQTEAGAADVIVAAYRTAERERYLVYPAQPYMEDVNVIWVARGKEFPFRQWDDLVGRKGTAMLGESYGQKFDNFIRDKLDIEWSSTPSQSLRKLSIGRAAYYPFSLHGGRIQVRQLGFGGRISHLPLPISSEHIYIAISKKSRYLKYLPKIEAALAARRADGTVARLIRKYSP